MSVFWRIFRRGRSRLAVGYYLGGILLLLLIQVMECGGGGGSGGGSDSPGRGGMIRLAWNSNTESDLAGYRVYYDTRSRVYDNSIDVAMPTQSGDLTTFSLTNLISGQTYYLAVTAYDLSYNESDFSNEVNGPAQ
jgi:hypothetical protein